MAALSKGVLLTSGRQWFADTLTYISHPLAIVRQFRPEHVRADFIAGLTVAIIMLPQAIAYALIAELPPQTGLYAAIVASIVGILWGSSVHMHSGPTNAASLLVLATLIPVVTPGTPEYIVAAGVLAVLVGFIRLLMGLARLGVLVNFVSDSVIIGFTAGAGILISVNQFRPLLRLSFDSKTGFFQTVGAILSHLPTTHWISLGVGLGTISALVLLKYLRPKLPGALISMIVASVVVALFRLDQAGVVVLGELPRSLPPLAKLPLFDFELMGQILTGALAIAAIGLVEAMSIARSIAAQSGQQIDSDQEFIGQGLSNIAAGFFSGYPCSGSFIRSAVNFSTGGKSPLAVIFASFFVLIALLIFAPLAAYLPRAALAGVLIVTAYEMVDRKEMKRIWYASQGDSAIMIATIIATLVLPLQFAVLAGIIVSIIRFLVRTSRPRVEMVVPDDSFRHFVRQRKHPACPQLGIITLSGPLYFGATQYVDKAIRANLEQNPGQQFLLLRMHLVDHIDVSGIHMLEAIVRLYRERGGDVFIAGLHRPIKRQMIVSGFLKSLGRDHFLQRDEAISYLFHKVIQPAICIYECPVRVFAECQALPKWSYGSKIPDEVIHPEHTIHSWSPDELKICLSHNGTSSNILIVDVREPYEFEKGHVPQAHLLPLRLMPKQGATLPTDCQIILICRIGRRSRLAGGILKDMGYESVFNLQGGILAWEAAGYPMAVGPD